ncbi:MAG TPA: hypothetical protein PLK94_10160, partial [Alphaproteobacteria bacterium]|nr:hypothetical protein [Alphaproteobacteria bacterium]
MKTWQNPFPATIAFYVAESLFASAFSCRKIPKNTALLPVNRDLSDIAFVKSAKKNLTHLRKLRKLSSATCPAE